MQRADSCKFPGACYIQINCAHEFGCEVEKSFGPASLETASALVETECEGLDKPKLHGES